MQFFNAINCRVIGKAEYNVFKKFFSSIPFIIVLAIIFGVQFCASNVWFFKFIFDSAEISGAQFGQCIFTGFTVMIAAFLLKLTPKSWVDQLPAQFDENSQHGQDGWIMRNFSEYKGEQVAPI